MTTLNIGNLGAFRTAQEHRAVLVNCWLKPRLVGAQRDTDYRGIPVDIFKEILGLCRRPDPAYAPERFDCNKFSITFMADVLRWWGENADCGEALEAGFVWLKFKDSAGTHQVNFQVDNEGSVHLFEPQTNAEILGREVAECYEIWE